MLGADDGIIDGEELGNIEGVELGSKEVQAKAIHLELMMELS